MKILKGLAFAVLALVVALGALYVAMAEWGEVVVLHHYGEHDVKTVRLWVVDDAGQAWLRTGADNATWLPRVRAHPDVELERGEETLKFRALVMDDATTLARINQLSLEKYGWSEQLLRAGGPAPSGQVAIRLDPR
jgi:hypothetical protein